ncbi:MAG: sugar phosphate isomerase/epimerase family protein [Bryobacteraceae bacterium]
MKPFGLSRRSVLGLFSAAAAPLPAAPTRVGFRLGVCSYSFNAFQRRLAISMMKELRVHYASVKDFHLPYSSTPEEIKRARAAFEKAGITIVSGGTIYLQDEDPAALRKYFEYARRCGMPMMVAAPTRATLPAVEKLAREFDIQVAIHNHGPEDPHFPTPKSVLDAVNGRDPRMGLCMDLGHSLRTGADVVEELARAGTRLLDVHIKDLESPKDKKSQCDVGQGVMPVAAIFRQLQKMNYQGCVNLEYEINGDNPLPGMMHSFGYMRGVLAGMAAA